MKRRGRRERGSVQPKTTEVAPPGLKGGHYKPLSECDLARIVDAAYEVLGRTGIEVMPSNCRDVFAAAGCRVDSDRNRVFLPAWLIDEARATTPSEVILAGRKPEFDLHLGGSRVYAGTGGQAVNILDLDGSVRETRLSDNYHIGRLVDRLDHIHFYMRPVVSRDLANEDIDVNQFYACLAATPKHVMANAYMLESVPEIRELADMFAGGSDAFERRQIISSSCCWTVSPLRYAPETVDILDSLVAHGIPIAMSSAPQAGATSPAPLAGTLVQIVAEQLSGFAYVHLLKPGHPILMGCVPAQADLRTGSFTGGSAEFALLHAASAQLSQFLKVPIYNSSGISDSKIPDAQAGFEKGLTTVTAALAGSNYIHHSAGFLESLLTVAYEQYVIDNDVNGAAMRMLRGIEVSDDTLSIDVIDDVCNGVGHFLGHGQTIDLMQSEYLYPEVMNRASRADWEEQGGRDLREAAKLRAEGILRDHWPEMVTPELDADIRKHFNILLPESEMRPPSRGGIPSLAMTFEP